MQFEHRGPPPRPSPQGFFDRFSDSLDGDFFVTAKPFSLSLRERSGVRGKSASNCIDWASDGLRRHPHDFEPFQRFLAGLTLRVWDFEFVSNFGFRVSNLKPAY